MVSRLTEIRPRINRLELILIIAAMRTAKYDKKIGTDKWKIYRRFELLRAGTPIRERI